MSDPWRSVALRGQVFHYYGDYSAGVVLTFGRVPREGEPPPAEADVSAAAATLPQLNALLSGTGVKFKVSDKRANVLVTLASDAAPVESALRQLPAARLRLSPCGFSHCPDGKTHDGCEAARAEPGRQLSQMTHSVDCGPAFEVTFQLGPIAQAPTAQPEAERPDDQQLALL